MHLSQVLEVICDRGEGARDRWSVGSGYLVAERTVLTAAHVVANAEALYVRSRGGVEHDAQVLLITDGQVDLSLLEVPDAPPPQERTVYGLVSQAIAGQIGGCRAVGFPRFKEAIRAGRRMRDSVQVDGYIPTADGLVSGYLTLRVDAHPLTIAGAVTESAWAGMSGAAVFAGDVLVGVVSEHHLAEGNAALTVASFARLHLADEPARQRFWELIGVAPSDLVDLTPGTTASRVAKPNAVAALPPPLSEFTGRKHEVALVVDLLSKHRQRGRAVIIWGPPGVGKSQLAVQVAHLLANDYRDGACHIDLQGYSDNRLSAEQAAARILEVLAPDRGVPGDANARYVACREVLRSGKHVVVLDNASQSAQVRELLPGPCDSVVLVTSRSSLATLDAAWVELDVLDRESAIKLLKVMAEPDGSPSRGTDDEYLALVRICGHLPLALRIAGALLRARTAWNVGRLTSRLADENRRLGLLQRDDLAVRPVFESSYEMLDEKARELFAILGSVAAIRVAPWMAAALLDIDILDAEELLEQLVDAQLLRVSGTDAGGTPRYGFHDLVRLYAQEKLRAHVPLETLAAAEERMFSGYLALTLAFTDGHPIAGNFEFARTVALPWSATSEDVPSPTDPMEWLVEERTDIVAEIEHAYASGQWKYVWGLADILHAVFILTSHGPESRRVKDLAISAAQLAGDADAELETRFHLNSLLHYEFRYDEAVAELHKQRDVRRARGEVRKVAHLDLITGVVQRDGGMLGAAQQSLLSSIRALETLEDHNDPTLTTMIASAQQNLAVVYREKGRFRAADELLTQCLDTFQRYNEIIALGRGVHTRGILYLQLGRYDAAETSFLQSDELMRRSGDQKWVAIILLARARLAHRRHDWPAALRMLDECDDMFRAIADQAGHAQVQRSRAVTLRSSGRYEEADAAFASAHDQLTAIHDRRSHARLHYSMALSGIARKAWVMASTQLAEATRLFDVDDDRAWLTRVRVAGSRVPGHEACDLREELDALAALAGEGYLPLWLSEARRRLDAQR